MPTEKKVQAVEDLSQRLSRCTIAIATGFQGMKVSELAELRKRLRGRGVEYRVVKNTLAFLAAEKAGRAGLREIVKGSTGLALGYGEVQDVAKALGEYVRSTRLPFIIKGAIVDNRVLSPAEVQVLTTIPPREWLLADMVGRLQGPLYALMYAATSPLAGLVAVLQGRVHQLGESPSG